MMINESRRSRAHFDLPLVLLVFGLAAFGVLAVSVATFSTSSAELRSASVHLLPDIAGHHRRHHLLPL